MSVEALIEVGGWYHGGVVRFASGDVFFRPIDVHAAVLDTRDRIHRYEPFRLADPEKATGAQLDKSHLLLGLVDKKTIGVPELLSIAVVYAAPRMSSCGFRSIISPSSRSINVG
nr:MULTISPECIES: hypothetical protein [Rhodococcus]